MSAITDMSDTELVDEGAGPLETLLSHIYQFEVLISDARFVCHAFPFPLKSSYFRDAIQSFKTSSSNTDLRINLSALPGGCQAFKLIRSFCYDSRLTITKENVLDLLSASKFLGFTEVIASNNLCKQCQSFMEIESTEHGVPGIVTMLKYSTTDESSVRDYDFLFEAIAKQALAYQVTDDAEQRHKTLGLLLELAKLKPWFVDATLQEFDRLGVYMIEFFWCKGSPASLDLLLTDEEGLYTNKLSISSFFIRNLDICIDAEALAIGMLDPKKMVKLVSAHRGRLKSESVIKEHIASQLCSLEATDIKNLPRDVILELVSTSRKKQDLQHLRDLIDQVLLEEARERPWDGSVESKLKFQQLAECIDRTSHDILHDAVASFAKLQPAKEAEELWSMIDTEKLSPNKFDSAISLNVSKESSFTARLLRKLAKEHTALTKEHKSLKRKLSFEKRESKRRSLNFRPFTIFVRALDGRTLCVLVQSHTTVYSIMDGIKNQGNIQCKHPWYLSYQRKNLNETLPIASYGIEKDCTLWMKVLYAGERYSLEGQTSGLN